MRLAASGAEACALASALSKDVVEELVVDGAGSGAGRARVSASADSID
jgi:hypothetical protein